MKITHTYIKAANQQVLPANKQVKRIGQYLYKHIDSAYDMKKSPNMVDIYFIILYQKKEEFRTSDDREMHEMSININITTYQDKVRINILEVSPQERTIGFDTYKTEKLENLNEAFVMIMNKFQKRMNKAFEEYDFIF